MNRAILWFAVLYGEITSAVVLIVLAGYAVDTESGKHICEKVSLSANNCKGALGVFILLLTGYAMFHSFRRFMVARKEVENGD